MLTVKTNADEPLPLKGDPAYYFSYEPDVFQRHSFYAIEDGQHVLVTAHTGSGKTSVATYAVAHGLREPGKRVVYTAPIKALSNQVYSDLKRAFPSELIGIKTGDLDECSEDCDVLVLTTEILRNALMQESNGFLRMSDVSVVVFDEVHWIKDRHRGSVWEEALMCMPKHIQMVLLSATLPDAREFGSWVARVSERNLTYTTTPRRVVPLRHYVLNGYGERVCVMNEENVFNVEAYQQGLREHSRLDVNEVVKNVELPSLMFCFNKDLCRDFAESITERFLDSYDAADVCDRFETLCRKFSVPIDALEQTKAVKRLVMNGVGYHHAGLLPALKEIVQELFAQGFIKVLFVTETFAAGVNLPAKSVVFTGLSKYSSDEKGFRLLMTEEYGQMAGRAGRRGKDDKGSVYLCPLRGKLPALHEARKMMTGQLQPIVSHFSADVPFVARALTANGEQSDRMKSLGNVSMRSVNDGYVTTEKLVLEEDASVYRKTFETSEFLPSLELHYNVQENGYTFGAQKELKKYRKKVLPWISQNEEMYKEYKLYKMLCERAKLMVSEEEVFQQEFESVVEFLERMELMAPDTLAALGSVNESNGVLLVSAVTQGVFEGMTVAQAVALLSTLVESPVRTELLPLDNDDESNRELLLLAQGLDEISSSIVQETKGVVTGLDWRIFHNMMGVVKDWVESPETKPTLFEYMRHHYKLSMYEGDFVRYMLRVNNVCKECVKVAEILGDVELVSLLACHQDLIVKSIVTPESLYVQ